MLVSKFSNPWEVAMGNDGEISENTETLQETELDPCSEHCTEIPRGRRRVIPSFSRENFSDYTWSPIDEASLAQLVTMDPDSRCAYEKLGYLPDLRRFSLGEFRVDDRRTVAFEVIPELGEVSYSELSEFPAGTASSLEEDGDSSPSPLLRFLQVTDRSVPVPLALREFEDRDDDETAKLLVGRDLVDSFDDHGRQLSLTAAPAQAASEPGTVWTCFTGGLDTFSDIYCENKDISYCDNGAWIDLTRSSGSKRRYVSHSRVACCSNYSAHVEHQFRYWSWTYWKWKWTTVKYPLPPAAWLQTLSYGDVKYWKHVGGRKRRRKVRIWTGGGSGYFRAWTAFYN